MENQTYGHIGVSTCIFEMLADAVDVVHDFDVGEDDILDMSLLLADYDPLRDSIDDFVFLSEKNGNTVISVDSIGSGDQSNARDILILEGVRNITLMDLINDPTVAH